MKPSKVYRPVLCFTACLLLASLAAPAQTAPLPGNDVAAIYDRLFAQIKVMPIFDGHGHVGYPDDPDVDAMVSPPGRTARRLGDDNPELVEASKELFGYPFNDLAPEHAQWLVNKKAELKKQYGNEYFTRILDQLHIETSVANRVAMPDYLSPKRFKWVCFVDNLLFPFDNRNITTNPDLVIYMPLQEKLLKRNMARVNVSALPDTLDGYLAFAQKLLETNKSAGAIGIKFEIAYFRSLHFDDPPKERAEAIYRKYHSGGSPTPAEYMDFEDYIVRQLIERAGKLKLTVHFHTAVGIGDYFSVRGGNVLNLENILRDARYNDVYFLLLHGGYPFERAAIWLGARKNVYLDSSLMGVYLYPAQLKDSLRSWLEIFPDKISFGSDAFPFSAAVGAEESYWLAVTSARKAVAAALAEMVSEHEVTETKALEMARGYLHDNAVKMYSSAGIPLK
jgi:hypothetical protein